MRVVFRIFCVIIFASTLTTFAASDAIAVTPLAPQSGSYVTTADERGYSPANGRSQTPLQTLERAVQWASNGKIKKGYSIASQAYSKGEHDPIFVAHYIDALTEMAQQKGTAFDKSILNSAITAANNLHKSKMCSGQGDAEIAYHFMKALGKLGDEVLTRNKRIAGQLYSAQGKIAQNLRHNPGYPSQSLNVLGAPMMNAAKAHAINNDEASAFETMQDAFDVGFTDFDGVKMDPVFADVDQTQLDQIVRQQRAAYKRKLVQWSRDELARFGQFQINFDVANVDGGRIKSADLKGKVAVVDLWATWCPPCREGIPHFVKLDHEYSSKKIAVIGISMDEPSDPASAVDTVKNFGIDNGIDYKLAVGTNAISSQIPGKVLLPTTLFLDQHGNVRYIASGYHDFMQLEAITKTLANEMMSADKTASR